MDFVEFGLMMRIFLSAGTILSFVTMVLFGEEVQSQKYDLDCKFLRDRLLSGLHAPVFALLDINDQEAAKTERSGSSRTSPLSLRAGFRGGLVSNGCERLKAFARRTFSCTDPRPRSGEGSCDLVWWSPAVSQRSAP